MGLKGDNRKLMLNTVFPVLLQLSTIISAFVLPRLIMQYYGSEVNGLVSSITQFLSIISFLEMGVGSVIRYNLYKPLADKDNKKISEIVLSSNSFFRKIALILLVYVIILILVYPSVAAQDFSHLYTAVLIAAMSISFFSQYYFGQTNQILLTADQKGYIQYSAQILTILLNTVCSIILILVGCSIQTVKLVASLIYLLRPVYLELYVNKHYKIDKGVKYKEEPIKQKWNGIAQHVAAVILESTDVIVLTLLSSLQNVSVYSTYHLVANGIRAILVSTSNGIEARLGRIIAQGDKERLQRTFSFVEWVFHTATTLVFGCTLVLILPFISIYTKGITDANYYQPLFGILISLAYSMQGYRLPYILLIFTSGKYKETQMNFWITAALNIIISIILVSRFGLIGVAIGTLIAMLYQTVWMAWYDSKFIVERKMREFIIQVIVDSVGLTSIFLLGKAVLCEPYSYFNWFLQAIKVLLIAMAVIIILNMILYRKNVFFLMRVVKDNRRNKDGL